MRADLHTHSSVSDGTEPPAVVIRRGAEAGLDVIALTDHDTVAGHREAASALPSGMILLPGAELSCRLEGHSVHLLAYLFNPEHDELAGEMAEIRESRLFRARAMVDKLAGLGVPVTWEQVSEIAGGGVVGRPHIARAMIDAGVVSSIEEAFKPDWIGPGGPAYVSRYALDPARAIRLVSVAGGVTVLAHPRGAGRGWQIPADVIAELARAGLAGIEINHPQHDETERGRLAELAKALRLIPSGGSDDHGALTGHRIGSQIAPDDSYEALIQHATGAKPVTGTDGGQQP
ncbi:MAG TPA: PHP domain-containing protein [Streptosporangiaceae bacterium]|nr:PHP domain-containing protein [Streptosporangiaceae bacterium]